MKKFLLSLALTGFVTASHAAMAQPNQPMSDKQAAETVAIVNGKKLTGYDLQAAYMALPPAYKQIPFDKAKDILVRQMVDQELFAEQARKEKLDNDPQVKSLLEFAAESVLRDRYILSFVEGKMTEDAKKAHYEEIKKNRKPQDEVKARHILVKDEKIAKDIVARLKKGEDFAKLSKQFSEDAGSKADGELGYFTQDKMVKPFAEKAFALKKDEISDPVQTQFGWHVIQVQDRRKQQMPSFDEMKNQIENEMAEKILTEKLDASRKDAKIEILSAKKEEKK